MLLRATRVTIVVVLMLTELLSIFLLTNSARAYQKQSAASPLSVVSVTSISTSASSNQSAREDNTESTPLFVALIAAISAIFVALTSGWFAFKQTRRNALLEREKLEIQYQNEQKLFLLQKKIEEQLNIQERERQRKEMDANTALEAMHQAQNMTERIQAYRETLNADPRIARLQILDMSRPLDVMRVYVRVQLHLKTRYGYEISPALLSAETQQDPSALLQANLVYLEERAHTALEPLEAIFQYTHCVIIGDPGAGKTTLLKFLALQSINKQLSKLPDMSIHIELNAFANSNSTDLLDFASTKWDDRYGFPKEEALTCMKEHLKEGKALLLLDGLDETVIGNTFEIADSSYRRVATAIMKLATRYHRSPIVVTARKADYHQRMPLEGFTELEVLDFRPQDIHKFVTNWFTYHSDSYRQGSASDLNIKLELNPRIQALATNPLLLSLIIIVYEAHLTLPDRRTELYRLCVETLLTKWDASRNIRRRHEFKPEHKLQLLEEVAWYFHCKGRRYFPQDELLSVIANFLPVIGLSVEQNERVLAEIATENGLLKEQARNWYGFLHLTLQEYFVAKYIVDHNELATLLKYQGASWWDEVILLYAGQTTDAGPLLQHLLQLNNEEALSLAGRCLAARPSIRQTSLREEIKSELFNSLVELKYPTKTDKIAEALVEIGGIEINTRLVHMLSNETVDKNFREALAVVLGKLAEPSVAPLLLSQLMDAQLDHDIRQSITDAFSKLVERFVALNLQALISDAQLDANFRQTIAAASGKLGESSVAPALQKLLSDPQLDLTVRQSIIVVLCKLGEAFVTPALLKLLSDPQLDISMRQNIAIFLGSLEEPSIASALQLLLSAQQLDPSVRGSIVAVLEKLGKAT